MKMSVFWGALLVLLGLSMVFPMGIPVFRILFAAFFIYLGVKVLLGGFGHETINHENWDKKMGKNNTVFNSKSINYSNEDRVYNVIFGSGTIDLTTWDPDDHSQIEVNIIFGEGILKIDKDMPVRITINSVFSGAQLPQGDVSVIGKRNFETEAYSMSEERLDVELTVIFGSLKLNQQ